MTSQTSLLKRNSVADVVWAGTSHNTCLAFLDSLLCNLRDFREALTGKVVRPEYVQTLLCTPLPSVLCSVELQYNQHS